MKRSRLKLMSDKRRNERDARITVIEQVIHRDGNRCWAEHLMPQIACGGPLDPDEYDQRGVRPGGHLDPTNVQMLCRFHHDWKTEHAVEAARLGLRPFPRNYTGEDGHADRLMHR